ncbi:MAG: alpha/beta hydrolase [Eubacterium sp.]|nr:alpha/beta hydrolase [Eubacterium sp.]
MKKKPVQKKLLREQIQRRVNAVRFVLRLTSKQMVDMEHTIGDLVTYETDEGPVRALTYGFEVEDKRPLVVNIHGSGFVMGSAAMDDPFMMQFVEKCGVKVISIDYPLSPDVMFPTALNQCYALVRYVKKHADELGIDGERIVLMGHSAGGNISSSICLLENNAPTLGLKGLILDYPPTDLSMDPYDKPSPKGCLPPKLCRIFDAAYCTEEERTNPLVSPALSTPDMVKGFPPTLVITAGLDSLAEETERFKDTLVEAGVDVTFKRFEGAIHGFTIMTEKQSRGREGLYEMSLAAWQMMVDFVNERI